MEHASPETSGPGDVPRGELDDLEHIRVAPQAGEREPTGRPLVPVEAPERRGAALEDLDVDRVLTRRPLGDAHQGHGGGETAGVRRDPVENGLSRPHGRTPLPDHAGLLCHPHATEVTEGLKAHLLQGLIIGKTEQGGDKTGNGTSTQQLVLQLSWR